MKILKKIGFITFTSDNYGACLQAFAVRKALEQFAENVEFLSYNCPANGSKQQGLVGKTFLRARRLFYGIFHNKLKEFIVIKKIYAAMHEKFNQFRKQFIYNDYDCYLTEDQLREKSKKLDAVVCGSDMIWSAEFVDVLNIYLLNWCDYCPRISYAPSLGDINVSTVVKDMYVNALPKFASISCREKSASDFVESLINRRVETVVDPTLLFGGKQWSEWFPCETNEVPYILVYCFEGINDEMRSKLKKICEIQKFDLRFILSNRVEDFLGETRFGDGIYGPSEFVHLFANAAFTVVNGYHGLLFSLIFEKPFLVLHRDKGKHWAKHESRMSDLLTLLNLNDRYIDSDGDFDMEYLSLDYTSIRSIIADLRNRSWMYLEKSLIKVNEKDS